MRVVAIVFGVILLLPGACSLYFIGVGSRRTDPDLMPLWLGTFVVGLVGALLIVWGARRASSPPPTNRREP